MHAYTSRTPHWHFLHCCKTTHPCILPTGEAWYNRFLKRMQALPEYADVVETKSGRATDTRKLMYYNTENINYWYDQMIKILCDELKIAKRTTAKDAKSEITWTGNKDRILFSDETAVKDRNEAARNSRKFKKRLTRCMKQYIMYCIHSPCSHGTHALTMLTWDAHTTLTHPICSQSYQLDQRSTQTLCQGRAVLCTRDWYNGVHPVWKNSTSGLGNQQEDCGCAHQVSH